MDREDNTVQHLDNFMQNAQNYVENLQNASGGGGIDALVAGDEFLIGGKFEENVEHDDEEEWKYIKEVQQSEKQRKAVDDDDDDSDSIKEAEKGVRSNGNGNIGNSDVDGGLNEYDDDIVGAQHEIEIVKGVVGDLANNTAVGIAGVVSDGNEEEDVEIIKNDGDFSTTSNTASITGEEADADAVGANVLQVEMKIEAAEQRQLQHEQLESTAAEHFGGKEEETEEEEPSSLATNTTNGTSSLSENPPQQLQQELERSQQQLQQELNDNAYDINDILEDKENADPLTTGISVRPADFDSELHSQLNPDAKEFVPSFGSKPTTPTSPVAIENAFAVANANVAAVVADAVDDDAFGVGEPAVQAAAIDMQQHAALEPHPSAVPRHLLSGGGVDDDFVAQSPRKGRCSNMDAIALPEENDFEHEAAKRPHELEQEADLIGDGALQLQQEQQQKQQQLLFGSELENGTNDVESLHLNAGAADCIDFQHQSPISLIDHGPETSVDLDVDIALESTAVEDVMKQSIYIENNAEPIEDILNTVQPIPTDLESVNNSFVEETSQETGIAGDKELLNVEEKEHISHSPSTEEMQFNLQNDLNASAKDIPQIPIDLNNAFNMQESFYAEHTSSEHRQQQQQEEENKQQEHHEPQQEFSGNENLLGDTTNPFDDTANLIDTTFNDDVHAAPTFTETIEPENVALQFTLNASPAPSPSPALEEDVTAPAAPADELTTLTPLSTDEKHLFEETKEQIEQKSDELLLTKDGILSQIEEAAQTTATIAEDFFAQGFGANTENIFAQVRNAELIPTETAYADFATEEEEHQQQLQQEQQQEREQPIEPKHNEPLLAVADEQQQPPEQQQQIHEQQLPQPTEETSLVEDAALLEEQINLDLSEPAVSHVQEEVLAAVAPETTAEDITAAISETKETPLLETAAIVAATAAAVAATAAVATSALKKTDAVKKATATKTTSAPSKPKASETKKPAATTTAAKTGATKTTPPVAAAAAARPRTAPAKTATSAATRKPLTSTASAATKAAPKTATTTATRSTHTTTPAAPRTNATKTAAAATTARTTATTAAARRPGAAASNTATAAATNGTTSKPRPATAPTKPTTLGISATAKPKLTSPRTTLTSQLRKTAGPTTSSSAATTAARSPIKPTSTTNGIANRSATHTTSASRTRTTVTTTTTTTKTFTARPAPKTALSAATTTTTTTRRSLGVGAASPNALRKSSPNKLAASSKLSPIKSATGVGVGALKSKTKETTKTTPPTKTQKAATPIKRKQETTPKSNGTRNAEEAVAVGAAELLAGGGDGDISNGVAGDVLKTPQLNGGAHENENGADLHLEQAQQPLEQQEQTSLIADI